MDIRIGNTWFTWGTFVVIILSGILGGIMIILAIYNLYRKISPRREKERWKKVTAYTTGKSNRFTPALSSKYHIQQESREYEIEYWVNQVRYVKYLQCVPNTEKGVGVDILYDKKHPSRIRETMDVRYEKQKLGIMDIGITLIFIFVGGGLILFLIGNFVF